MILNAIFLGLFLATAGLSAHLAAMNAELASAYLAMSRDAGQYMLENRSCQRELRRQATR